MKWEWCEVEGLIFTPISVNSFGSWHQEALITLKKLGRQLARAVGREEAEVVRHLRQRLGVLLVRDNMAMLQAGAHNLPTPQVDGDADMDN